MIGYFVLVLFQTNLPPAHPIVHVLRHHAIREESVNASHRLRRFDGTPLHDAPLTSDLRLRQLFDRHYRVNITSAF